VLLQERVYHSRIRDVDHLKERLIEKWRRFIKASLIVHYSSGGFDFEPVPARMGDTLNINCSCGLPKRWTIIVSHIGNFCFRPTL
jgi:hypothetical protein